MQRVCSDFLSLSSLFWEQRKWHTWNQVTDAQVRQLFHYEHTQTGFPSGKRWRSSQKCSYEFCFAVSSAVLFRPKPFDIVAPFFLKVKDIHLAARVPCCSRCWDCRSEGTPRPDGRGGGAQERLPWHGILALLSPEGHHIPPHSHLSLCTCRLPAWVVTVPWKRAGGVFESQSH